MSWMSFPQPEKSQQVNQTKFAKLSDESSTPWLTSCLVHMFPPNAVQVHDI